MYKLLRPVKWQQAHFLGKLNLESRPDSNCVINSLEYNSPSDLKVLLTSLALVFQSSYNSQSLLKWRCF